METVVGPGKERADGAAVQRSGDAAMLILPWTKQILCVVWDHLRLLVHVIYYSFLAVFQMFRLEVHLRITDETGHHVQHMSTSDRPAESFILSSLFDGTNMLSKCGVDTYAGGSHATLLSGLRPEDLCCSLVDDFVLRATECFSESDEDLCLGHHPSWHPNNSADWDIHVAEDLNGTADYNTPVEVFEAAPESECTKDLEESSWDDDYDEDDDEFNLQQNQAMWESFTKCNDPYNPLSFSACISTCSMKEYTRETAESSNGMNPNSTQKEETLQNKSQKTYQDTDHVSSDSESGWDSSCESAAEEDEDSQKIWDSFSHPEDPYNPLHFTACTSSSRSACSGGVSHGEETPSVVAHEDDDELDGLGQDDRMGGSESDEAHCSEEDELWNSFSQGDDPYHPLHFRACLRTSPPAQGMANLGPQLTDKTTQPEGSQKVCRSKPRLPSRHFKHCCSQRSWDSPKTVPWRKRRLGSGIPAEPQKNDKPQIKKVRFSPVIHVHVMRAWSSALQASRKGQWEEMARDRDRFRRRIAEVDQAIGYCLSPSHREQILARIQDT